MSTSETTTGVAAPPREICIYSHSSLMYWWPVWFFGFIFAIFTYVDGHRMAIIPSDSKVIKNDDGSFKIEVGKKSDRLQSEMKNSEELKTRVSSSAAIGPIFLSILMLVIFITNVPLRGLWSLVAVFGVILFILAMSLFDLWDSFFYRLGNLHVFINMSGYMFISTFLFILWSITVFFFDRRKFIIFSAGQVRVCEEVGGGEKVYDTTGMTFSRQRDDWLRHIFLGLGTGDLVIRTSGADRHEIQMPNVSWISYKLPQIEKLMRHRSVQDAK